MKPSFPPAAVAAIAVLALAGPANAAPVPLPDQDPFYAVPANIAGLANGTILASRQIDASAYSLPLPATAWQLKYRSTDVHGQPTADVTTVLVPLLPWLGRGPRPLVSYQTAEDGVGSKCSPSYALRAGLASLPANSEAETGLIALALLRGFAVAAPDYEGPHSEFLGAAGEAYGVLDGIRAALRFKPAGFSAATAVGLWGYSGGALASALAAQAQPAYAPELKLAGVALGGVVADLKATLDAFSGSAFGGALAIGFVGVDRSYPQENLLQYLNAAGKQAVAGSQTDCIDDAAAKYPFASIGQFEAAPGVVNQPAMTAFLASISPLGFPGTPAAPVYDYHAILDELAPIGPDRRLMARFCTAGVAVDHVEDLTSEHITLTVTGAPGAIAYLADRFAGKPVPNNCPTSVH